MITRRPGTVGNPTSSDPLRGRTKTARESCDKNTPTQARYHAPTVLILSVFPGIDILGLAFEREGHCVVRGPDPIFGGDVRGFHPHPVGVFQGVIGGPPCQVHSRVAIINRSAGWQDGDLIPEFCRVVAEAQPEWWLMENVPDSTVPDVPGFRRHSVEVNLRQMPGLEETSLTGPEQQRVRWFHFGTRDGRKLRLHVAPKAHAVSRHTVLAGHGPTKWQRKQTGGQISIGEMCRLQGLPEDFADRLPFTMHGKRRVIGNAVPLHLGRELARAVRRAYSQEIEELLAE